MGKYQQHAEEHRPQRRNHDASIDGRQAGAVNHGRFDDAVVDAAQAGQEQGHHESRRLPDAGDHHRIDRKIGIYQPVEMEVGEAPVVHHFFQAQARIQNPLPGSAGNNERERHRIQVDRAQCTFAADLLVQEDRHDEADGQAEQNEQAAENAQVGGSNPPAIQAEQRDILIEAGNFVVRQHP